MFGALGCLPAKLRQRTSKVHRVLSRPAADFEHVASVGKVLLQHRQDRITVALSHDGANGFSEKSWLRKDDAVTTGQRFEVWGQWRFAIFYRLAVRSFQHQFLATIVRNQLPVPARFCASSPGCSPIDRVQCGVPDGPTPHTTRSLVFGLDAAERLAARFVKVAHRIDPIERHEQLGPGGDRIRGFLWWRARSGDSRIPRHENSRENRNRAPSAPRVRSLPGCRRR